MTAYFALVERARMQPGQWLLVLGAGGGVGLAAVDVGRAIGLQVIAAASSAEKREMALSRGAVAVNPVEPVSYPLDHAALALADQQQRRFVGKAVLVP